MINKIKSKLKKLSSAIVAIVAIVLFTIPSFAAPFTFSYTFTNDKVTVIAQAVNSSGVISGTKIFQRRSSDGAFYTSGNTLAYNTLSFVLEPVLSVQVQPGQILKSDATGNASDSSSSFRLYCEGSQGQSLVSKAKNVRFTLVDDNGIELATARSVVQKPNANYIYAAVPQFKIERSGVLSQIVCDIEFSSYFSGDVTIFFSGRTWLFTLYTSGDPGNPDYSSPNTSTLDEYESAESNIMGKIDGGLSDGKSLFQSFSNNVAPFIQGTMFMSNVIGKIISGNANINSLLMISLSLGIFGLLTNILIQVLNKPRDHTSNHKKGRDK